MKLDLQINNFGKVKNANIKLRPFTVIAGPNSCGKSFITKALYCIFHELNEDVTLNFLRDTLFDCKFVIQNIEANLFRPSADDIIHLQEVEMVLEEIQIEVVNKFDLITLSIETELTQNIKPLLEKLSVKFDDFIKPLINTKVKLKKIQPYVDSFQRNISSIEDYSKSHTAFYSRKISQGLQQAFIKNFQVSSLKELINFNNLDEESHFSLDKLGKFAIDNENGAIKFSLKSKYVEDLQRLSNVVYIESPIYWKLRSTLTDIQFLKLSSYRRRNTSGSTLSGVPEYFYDLIKLLNTRTVQTVCSDDTLNLLFGNIVRAVDGKLDISSTGEIRFQQSEYPEKQINLNATASGIVNLGMLGLLIEKSILSKGSMLFIDEPEVNLHPAWQHLLCDVLFELSRAGVNIMIATHSIDMIYKLENIMKNNEDLVSEDHFGINMLNENGVSKNLGGGIVELLAIKENLGKPYVNLFDDRLPRII